MLFCTGGYREVAKEVEDPVDLERFVVCRPCLPEGGKKEESMPATLDVGARQDEQMQ